MRDLFYIYPMELIGNNIIIRDWKLSDIHTIQYWYSGQHAWMKLDAPYFAKPSDEALEQRIAYYKKLCDISSLTVPRQNLVISRHDALIGNINWYYTSKDTNWISLGLAIFDPQHWNKGYGTEALYLWTDYLFEHMPQIVRLDLYTWSGNMGMQKTALKLGYKEEARFRNARKVEQQYYDSLGFGILRAEWEARKHLSK